MYDMDEKTARQLQALLPSLKALQESVRRAYYQGNYTVSRTGTRTYTTLQGKIAALLPADDYVRDTLTLDIREGDSDAEKTAQLEFAATQLFTYVRSLLHREEAGADFAELKAFGRDLQEQIISTTRSALRRALSGLEHIPTPPPPPHAPHAPQPPQPPRGKVRVEIDTDADDENADAPQPPPTII